MSDRRERRFISDDGDDIDALLRLDVANARLQSLYAKQGRLGQFTSAAERDNFLRAEIKSLEEFQKKQSHALQDLRAESGETKQKLSELETQESDLRSSLETRHQQLKELEEKITRYKDEKARLTERRK
jgi:structural maintenance of chromosome 3 (chondroitin sulfate proteoglycan 6)